MPLSRWSFPCKGNKSLIRNWRRVKTSINVQSWSWHRLKRSLPFCSSDKTKAPKLRNEVNSQGDFLSIHYFSVHGTMLSVWVTKTWSNRRLGWPGSAACGLGKAWATKQSGLFSGKLSQRGQMINLVKKKAWEGFFPEQCWWSSESHQERQSSFSPLIRCKNTPKCSSPGSNEVQWLKMI